jgi:hypothetical protein
VALDQSQDLIIILRSINILTGTFSRPAKCKFYSRYAQRGAVWILSAMLNMEIAARSEISNNTLHDCNMAGVGGAAEQTISSSFPEAIRGVDSKFTSVLVVA